AANLDELKNQLSHGPAYLRSTARAAPAAAAPPRRAPSPAPVEPLPPPPVAGPRPGAATYFSSRTRTLWHFAQLPLGANEPCVISAAGFAVWQAPQKRPSFTSFMRNLLAPSFFSKIRFFASSEWQLSHLQPAARWRSWL